MTERLDPEAILRAAKEASIAMEDRLTRLLEEGGDANHLAHTLTSRQRAINAGEDVAMLYTQAPEEYTAALGMLEFRHMPKDPLPALHDINTKGATWASAAEAELTAGSVSRHLGPDGTWVDDQTPAQITAIVQTGLLAYRDSFASIGLPPRVSGGAG